VCAVIYYTAPVVYSCDTENMAYKGSQLLSLSLAFSGFMPRLYKEPKYMKDPALFNPFQKKTYPYGQ
jgi:hypothetical protein